VLIAKVFVASRSSETDIDLGIVEARMGMTSRQRSLFVLFCFLSKSHCVAVAVARDATPSEERELCISPSPLPEARQNWEHESLIAK
jgi:hypothetical protein